MKKYKHLKQDIIQAVRKGNCPEYKQNSHACFGCPFGELGENTYVCVNTRYDKKTYKVRPRKVKCKHKCGGSK